MKYEITNDEFTATDIEQMDTNYAMVNYDSVLRVSDDVELELTGWVLVGWVAPGDSNDIDGSGLSNWGSSQPGFWSVCDTDGQFSGIPVAMDDGAYYDDIRICTAVTETALLTPAMVPEWQRILKEVEDIEPSKDGDLSAWIQTTKRARTLRDNLVAKINDAIDDGHTQVSVTEPEADDIYHDLDQIPGLEDLEIVTGNYKGCGNRVAWVDNYGEYQSGFELDFSNSKTRFIEAIEAAALKSMPTGS